LLVNGELKLGKARSIRQRKVKEACLPAAAAIQQRQGVPT